jgi:hypothetical protein
LILHFAAILFTAFFSRSQGGCRLNQTGYAKRMATPTDPIEVIRGEMAVTAVIHEVEAQWSSTCTATLPPHWRTKANRILAKIEKKPQAGLAQGYAGLRRANPNYRQLTVEESI